MRVRGISERLGPYLVLAGSVPLVLLILMLVAIRAAQSAAGRLRTSAERDRQ
jgi:hypothetical protein